MSDHTPTKRNWISFANLMGMQTQNAFNDKALQYTLVPLGTWLAAQTATPLSGYLQYILAALIVTPFILFAPLAGWASDSFSKKKIILFSSFFQIIILLLAALSIATQNLTLGIIAFFLLALQSTILSPAKVGIIKELVGSRRLGFASGMLEMFTILAILAGSILMGIWFDQRVAISNDGWQAASLPINILLIGGLIAVIAAFFIEKTPAQKSEPFRKEIVWRHFEQLKELFSRRSLRLSALGIAFFWFFGGYLQLTCMQIAQDLYGKESSGFGTSNSFMMLAAGGGIALGAIVSSLFSRQKIELGLIPIGGLLMTVGTIATSFCTPESSCFYLFLVIAGAGSALFLVPVNAWLQDKADPAKRGNVLAASNLLNCLGGILAVALQLSLKVANVSSSIQFVIIGLISLLITIYVTRLVPAATVLFIGHLIIRKVYRLRTRHRNLIPETGGVLLTPNHLSYHDVFLISAASTRPVRFLMFDDMYHQPYIHSFASLFNTVPVSATRAKEALKTAADTLAAGDVVCIFPEGQITRTGALNEIKGGFQIAARRANCPVVPLFLSGVWGLPLTAPSPIKQFFSRTFPSTKRLGAKGVTVSFSAPIPPKEATTAVVEKRLRNIQHRAIRRQASNLGVSSLKKMLTQDLPHPSHSLSHWEDLVHHILKLPRNEQLRLLENAIQVCHFDIFRSNHHLHSYQQPLKNNLIWGVVSALHQIPLTLHPDTDTSPDPLHQGEDHLHIHPENFPTPEEATLLRPPPEGQEQTITPKHLQKEHLPTYPILPAYPILHGNQTERGLLTHLVIPTPPCSGSQFHQPGHQVTTQGLPLPGQKY